MNDIQENKLSAYEAVDNVLNSDEHKAIDTLQVELGSNKFYTGDPITIKPGDQINLKIELESNE